MRRAIPACAIAVTLMAAMIPTAMHGATPTGRAIQPQTLPRLGTVDTRFQSYNVEMAEVIGGEFWKPYTAGGTVAKSTGTQSFEIGKTPGMFEARPPIDLANHRLRVLAAALGPASVRVSGTWANSVYFQDHDEPRLAKPPPGFQSVLTRAQWRGVIEFSRAVDAELRYLLRHQRRCTRCRRRLDPEAGDTPPRLHSSNWGDDHRCGAFQRAHNSYGRRRAGWI